MAVTEYLSHIPGANNHSPDGHRSSTVGPSVHGEKRMARATLLYFNRALYKPSFATLARLGPIPGIGHILTLSPVQCVFGRYTSTSLHISRPGAIPGIGGILTLSPGRYASKHTGQESPSNLDPSSTCTSGSCSTSGRDMGLQDAKFAGYQVTVE